MATRKNLSRRDFLKIGVLTAAGTVAAACVQPPAAPAAQAPQAAEGEAPQAAAAPAEQVSIDFWYGWTPDLITKTLDGVAQNFMDAHPNIQVKTAQHEWGEKLLTSYAAGTPPDIHEHYLSMSFGARDQLLSLDERIAGSTVIKRENIDDRIWAVDTWEGKTFAVPSLAFFAETGLCISKGVYDKAGLKLPDDVPTTWDGLFEQAKQYTTFDQAGNIDVLWIAPGKSSRWMPTYFGLNPYDEKAHKWSTQGEIWESLVLNIARFYTEFDPEKIEGFFQAYPAWVAVPGNAFASDKLAMIEAGYWIPGELDKNAPGKEFYYTWPVTGGSASGKKVAFWGAHSLMIPKQSKAPDAAWQLLEWYSTVESAEAIFEGPGWISPNKEFWATMNVDRYAGLDYFVNHAAKEAELVATFPASPALAYYQNHFQPDVVDPVIYGDKDVKAALAEFNEALDAEEQRILSAQS